MSALVVVQARLGSTRLPGKVLMDIGGHPCLWHVMERVKLAGLPYILTVPDASSEDGLYQYARGEQWPVSRGPHPDLLRAFIQAIRDSGEAPTHVIRITADCPFVSLQTFQCIPEEVPVIWPATYWSNAHPYRDLPKGLDVEVFTVSLLAQADYFAGTLRDREHVTPWIRRHLGISTSTDDGEFRVTLDTTEDLAVLQDIARTIDVTPPHPTLDELRAYFTAKAIGG